MHPPINHKRLPLHIGQPLCSFTHLLFSFFQVIGPLEQGEVFNQDDFLLLESIIFKTSADLIKSKINTMGVEEDRWVWAGAGVEGHVQGGPSARTGATAERAK